MGIVSQSTKIYIAGHRGMVGSALLRHTKQAGFSNVITATREELDLTNQVAVFNFLKTQKPEVVIIAAAKVGGIHANNAYPAEFIYENLTIATHLIHGAFQAGVTRLLFLGSSCIYPKNSDQPIDESSLLTSPLELTNEAYAIAKIAGLKLCQYYRKQYDVLYHSVMPSNLYGLGDNYHLENSHVIPAIIRRFHEAKMAQESEVKIWGTGEPRREFLYVDDLAKGCFHLLRERNPPDWVNLGFGEDITILKLAELIAGVVGFKGEIKKDLSKPDGALQKLMNNKVLEKLGWKPLVSLSEGLSLAYQDFWRVKTGKN